MESKTSLMKWANVAAFVVTLIVNSLAGTGLINGKSTGSISDKYATLVTPAGYVFSIWSIIYILLFVFVAFQALPSQKDKPFQKQVGVLFLLSCIFNIAWIFLWQYEYITLSVPLILALLASLIAIYLRLNIGKANVPMREKLSVHLPFSVYLAWITIASIADVAAALVSVSWNGFGISNETWAILVIAVALVIALAVTVTRRDIGYDLVIIWALVGIAAKQSAYRNIVMTAEVGAIIVAVALVLSVLVFRSKRQK
ncbi:MAG TPA: tryptophan-rich sensory protein [candidate division Zixibacteria bacterium]|nr:tryptophan-rich sensory protein [candidate division Zixibacteria bacterium]